MPVDLFSVPLVLVLKLWNFKDERKNGGGREEFLSVMDEGTFYTVLVEISCQPPLSAIFPVAITGMVIIYYYLKSFYTLYIFEYYLFFTVKTFFKFQASFYLILYKTLLFLR